MDKQQRGDAGLFRPGDGKPTGNSPAIPASEAAINLPGKGQQQLQTTGASPKDLALAAGLDPVGDNFKVEDINSVLRELVPYATARKYHVVPIERTGDGGLVVVTWESWNLTAEEELPERLGIHPIVWKWAEEKDVLAWMEAFYFPPDTEVPELVAINKDEPEETLETTLWRIPDTNDLAMKVNERAACAIIRWAIKNGASDIRISSDGYKMNAKMKVDGHWRSIDPSVPAHHLDGVIIFLKGKVAGTGMDMTEKQIALDGNIALLCYDQLYDLRVSTIPQVYGQAIALRILDSRNANTKLSQLGLQDDDAKVLGELIRRPHGVLLVTGPTGSGKSTTLYASLNEANDGEKNIITIEDPVEYCLRSINQVPVNPKVIVRGGREVYFGFPEALRAVLRQDPDVIMIGEIRDMATLEIALKAAQTGHFVLTTLHTNSAAATIRRLIDMGAEPFTIAGVLEGVLSQRLIRRLCEHCARPASLSIEQMRLLGMPLCFDYDTSRVRRALGCNLCADGYKGRLPIYEILLGDWIREAISSDVSTSALQRLAEEAGMRTLRQKGVERILAGETTPEEVLAAS